MMGFVAQAGALEVNHMSKNAEAYVGALRKLVQDVQGRTPDQYGTVAQLWWALEGDEIEEAQRLGEAAGLLLPGTADGRSKTVALNGKRRALKVAHATARASGLTVETQRALEGRFAG